MMSSLAVMSQATEEMARDFDNWRGVGGLFSIDIASAISNNPAGRDDEERSERLETGMIQMRA